jgi:23S rRNA pseudouridine2605 synthase
LLRHENDKAWLEITLREGKNRHIHRLGEHAGFQVMRLARVEYAGLSCEGLRPGMWRYLTVKELTALKGSYGVPKQVRPPPEAVPQKQERTRYKAWKTPQADSRSGRSVGRSRSTGDELHGTAANRGDARRSQGARSSTERGERSRDAGVRFPSESRGRERPSRATPKGSRTGERTPRAVGSRADERPARAIGRGARTDEHRAGATGRRSRAHSGFGDEPGSRRGDYDGRPPRTIEPGRRSASPSDKSVGFGRSSANARTSSRGGFERKSSSIAPARAPKTSRGRWRER